MSKRGFALLVVLCAVLLVTTGFAATKKVQHNRNVAADWNDLSLQNGNLPDVGSSVSGGGVGNLKLSKGGGPDGRPSLNPGTPDDWSGGTGNWSVAGNWNNGVPGAGSDVTINTGSDNVALDVGSTTISSLTLGGASGFSELSDGGTNQTLTISGALTIGASGYLQLTGATSTVTAGADSTNAGQIYLYDGASLSVTGNFDNKYVADATGSTSVINITGALTNESGGQFYERGGAASIGSLTNNGYFYIGSGASVNLTSQPGGITDVVAGSQYTIYGGFTAGANSAFNSLNSIEGTLYLANGLTNNITPSGGTLTNTGNFAIGGGTTVGITGDVVNNSYLTTAYSVGGVGNTLNISGTLTNNSQFFVYGSGDVANVGTFVNNGTLIVNTGATLNLTTQLNVTDVAAGSAYEIYGTFSAGANPNAFSTLNSIEGTLYLANGQTTNITPGSGTLTNVGNFAIGGASTVNITGDVHNGGYLTTAYFLGGSGNSLTISGNLTNNAGSNFYIYGSGDVANVGTLTNNGYTIVYGGATLNLTNQSGGITDAAAGSRFDLYGSFNDVLGGGSGFANLTSVEGFVGLANGQTLSITPGGGTLTIASGGTLDTALSSTTTINGHVNNSGFLGTGYYFGGANNTLNITGTLTNNSGSSFYMYDSGDVANVAFLNNSGYTYVGSGATLNLTNQLGGIIDAPSGSRFDLLGSFNDVMGGGSGFANLTSIEGWVNLANGQTTNITPNGGTLFIASGATFDAASLTSTTNITGNVNNSGFLATSYYYGGSNDTLSISGNLTNNPGSSFYLYQTGDVGNVGSLNNSGYTYVGPGATLNLTNQAGGITDAVAGSRFDLWGSFNDVAGGAHGFANLNSVEGLVILYGQNFTDTPGSGTLTISSVGSLTANYNPYTAVGTTLTISGNVDNSGLLATSYYYDAGNSTLNITGNLTNHANGDFWLYDYSGNPDVANVGSLTNQGYTLVGPYATLNLTNQLGGITDVVAGSRFSIYGNFNDVMGGTSAFANLNSVEGIVDLYGQTLTITPGSGTLTIASTGNLSANYNPYSGLGTTLNVNGNVDNSGLLATGNYDQSGGAVGANTLTINGALTNHSGSQLYLNGVSDLVQVNGNLNNSGTVTFANYNQTINVAGDMSNAGTTYVYYNGQNLNVGGNFDNSGTLEQYYSSANTVTVGGLLTNEASGNINLHGTGDLLQANGGLTNLGTITVQNGSAIDPPVLNNFGTITIDGLSKLVVGTGAAPGQGYIQLANGTLGEMIGAASYGVINITGFTTLNGTLDILLQGGYNPTPGSTYKFLNFTGGGLTGTFASIMNQTFNGGTEGWNVIYDNADGYVELMAYCVTTCAIADKWLGGVDVWSNGAKWSVGVPGSGNDVFIYSGGSDFVTYNMGSSTINSLTLGGAANGFNSELTDGGTNQTLTILQQLVVGQSGVLSFTGSGSSITAGANSFNAGQIQLFNGATLSITGDFDNSGVAEAVAGGSAINVSGTVTNEAGAQFLEQGGGGTANIGALVNNGYFTVGSGSTVNLTNQPGGITDVVAGSRFDILGNFNEGAGTNNAFENLTGVEGFVALANGGLISITPNGGTLTIANTGTLDFALATTVAILGDVSNSGFLATSAYFGGNNSTINITGTLNNSGNFYLYDTGDFANVGTLNNTGYTYVGSGASLHLTNQAGGVQDVVAGSRFDMLGSFSEGVGINNGFEQLTSIEGTAVLANGLTNTITPNGGTLTIAGGGTLDSSVGATVTINGDVSNSGLLTTGYYYGGNNSVINITGTLFNNGSVYLYQSGDTANVGTLDNTNYLYVGPGATLNLTNQAGGIQNVVAGSRFDLLGSFNDVADGASGFAKLTNIAGTVVFANGQTNNITPNGGNLAVQTDAFLDVSNGTTVKVNGDLNSSGFIYTGGYYGGAASTLTVTGNLGNFNVVNMYAAGDTIQVNGNLDNAGQIGWNNINQTLSVGGNLTNEAGATMSVNYTGSLLQVAGTLTNNGSISVTGGAAVDPPVLNNLGTINIDNLSKLVVGTGAAPGQGYIQLANGTLGEIITSTGFGVINVNGAANLAGTLNIMLQGSYDPANGTMFKFLNFTPNMLSGGFGTVLNSVFNSGTQQFMVDYNGALGFVELVAEPFMGGNVDYWLGGTGNWSNNPQWSLGNYPTPTQDAVIYSDIANDIVTLDLGSTSVNSLQIGGNDLTYYSELTDGGATQTLDIAGALNIGDSGRLILTGGSTITAGADSSNAGMVDLENASTLTINGNFNNNGSFQTGNVGGGNNFTVSGNFNNSGSFSVNGSLDLANVGSITNTGSVYLGYGTQLNLSNQPGGVTDVPFLASWQIYGSFTENSSNFGFENLSSVEGTIDLENVQSSTINPGGSNGTLTIASTGNFDIGNGTSLTIQGNVDNSGYLSTGRYNVGGNNLTITGNMTNEATGTFILYNGQPPNGPGDMASIGGNLTNFGLVDVEGGSTLTITGNASNSGNLSIGLNGAGGANAVNITGNLTNSGGITLGNDPETLTVNGDAGNSGGITLVFDGVFTVVGTLTNSNSGNIQLDHQGLVQVATLANSGSFDLENSSRLEVSGDADNSGSITTSSLDHQKGADAVLINGKLTNSGLFALYGRSNEGLSAADFASVGSLVNTGTVHVGGESELDVNGDVKNSGTIDTSGFFGSILSGNDIISISGTLNNQAGGQFTLYGGTFGGDLATIGNGMNNSGTVNVDGGSTLNITGDVTNSGDIFTDPGGNIITISGMLTNSGTFQLNGPGDMATVGNGMSNSGTVDLEMGSTLQITGNVTNSGDFYTDFSGLGGNNAVNITGTLDNTGLVWLKGAGDNATIAGLVTNELDAEIFLFGGSKATMNGGLNNAGTVDVESGSTLQVNGGATNSGNLYTNQQGAGGGNTINITGLLTNSGNFELYGPGDMATVGGLTNSGTADVEHGSTLQINGNVINSGDFYTDFSGLGGNNTVNITGTLDNTGLVWLKGAGDKTTIAGLVTNELDAEIFLFGGSKATMNGGLNNAGTVDVESGSTLQINGDATNSGNLYTNQQGAGGGNTVNITGMLTNEAGANFTLYGPGDMASIGNGLNNSGMVGVNGGSTLNITGDVTNSGDIFTDPGGNTITISGMLTNSGTFQLNGPGDMATIGGGVFNDVNGLIDLENASTLNITGDVTNNGTIQTAAFTNGGGNTVTINGNLNNGNTFAMYGAGDATTITGNVTNGVNGTFGVFGTGDQATISGGVTNSGLLELAGNLSITSTGALNNTGMVEVFNGATLQVNGDFTNSAGGSLITGFFGTGGNTVNVTGMVTNQGTEGIALIGPGDTMNIGGNLNNAAVLDIEGGSTLNVGGNVTNSGMLETNALLGAGGMNTIAITGMLTNTAAGQINLNGPGDVLQALAGLTNGGMINVNNGSSIDPPFFNNLGTLNIDGTSRFVVGTPTPMGGQGYIQLANGTLGEMISATGFGVINVNGSALLDGTLAILLQGGYNPAVGTTYKFLNFTAGMLNGIFANIENDIFNGGTEQWMVTYDNADGYVELTAEPNGNPVPEPATLLVLIPGLLGMGYGLRRRLSK